jgi:DNA polymerase III subunit epsilon
MQHKLHLKKPLAFFDLETTGINVSKDRIVEICIAKALPDGSVEVKTKRLNPGLDEAGNQIKIPLEASLVHGIYDADVADAPTFKNIAKSLAQQLEGCDLAGFNSNKFDIPLLVEEFLRADVDFETTNRKAIDVQRIFHMMEPRNLGAALKFYCGKNLDNAHSAEADTIATLEILDAQIERYKDHTVETDGVITHPIQNDMEVLNALTSSKMVDFAQRMKLNAKGEEVFNFGKHSGKKVTDVLKAEPSYYEWIMKGDFPLDTKRRLTEIKLRGFNA